jgi:hypothetical protein
MESLSHADERLPALAVTGPAQASAARTAIETVHLRILILSWVSPAA